MVQVLNSSYNQITKRAAMYRVRLDNSNNLDNELYLQIAEEFYSNITQAPKLSINTGMNLSPELSTYFKNFYHFIMLYNERLNQAEDKIKSFKSRLFNFYSENRKNIREVNRLYTLSIIKNRIFNSNSLVKNTFQDSLSLYKGFLIDPKTNTALSENDICNPKEESLTINEVSNFKIKSKFIYLDYTKTSGEIWGSSFSDVYNIYDSEKIFRCILRKSRRDIINKDYINNGASVSLIFDFEMKRYFNSIRISEASISRLLIEKNAIEYYNNENTWTPIDFNYDNLKDDYNIFFDTIYASKIRITFKQNSFLDIDGNIEQALISTNIEDEFNYYYYDLSINTISFEYSVYQNKGIYRSNDLLSIYKPLSLKFNVEHIFKDPDVVTELYLRVILFNDKNSVSKILDNIDDSLKFSSPTVDEIIPVNLDYMYEEVLVPRKIYPNRFESYLTFIPDLSSIEATGVDPNNITYTNISGELVDIGSISIYNSKGFLITINEKYDLTKKYSIKYKIKSNVKNLLGKSCYLENSQINFMSLYNESIGFLQPIIILRSKSKYNDSTSVIGSYKLIVQEKEYTNKKNITFDIFSSENKGVL